MLQTAEGKTRNAAAVQDRRILAVQSAVIVVDSKVIFREDDAGRLFLPSGELKTLDPSPKQSLSRAIRRNHGFELLIDFLLVLDTTTQFLNGETILEVVWGGYARYPFTGANNAKLIPKAEVPWDRLPACQRKAVRMWSQALEAGAIALPWW